MTNKLASKWDSLMDEEMQNKLQQAYNDFCEDEFQYSSNILECDPEDDVVIADVEWDIDINGKTYEIKVYCAFNLTSQTDIYTVTLLDNLKITSINHMDIETVIDSLRADWDDWMLLPTVCLEDDYLESMLHMAKANPNREIHLQVKNDR